MTVASMAWPGINEVLASISRVIDEADEITCLAHKDADADSLGSALAFALSMRLTGKRVRTVVPEPIPRLLGHLPGFESVTTRDATGDPIFTFDCATVARFGEHGDAVRNARDVVNIDHHVSNDGFGTINLIDPGASATGQVVHGLLRALGAPVTPAVATNLYAALLTDTGGFRHENTTEQALRLAADLVAEGADPGWVAMKSYKSRSFSRVRLEGLAISSMQTDMDGRLIWSEVTATMLAESGADIQEAEGVIDVLQSIETMQIALLFKENGDGRVKLSVRSREPYDATRVCTPFGGGGHRRAAGAEFDEPLPEVRRKVLDVARRLLDPHR